MTLVAVAQVEPLRVRAVEELHPLRDVRLGGLDHQVEVVRHQAVGVAAPLETLDHGRENLQKAPVVRLVAKDLLPAIASGSDVVEASGELGTKWAGHLAKGMASGSAGPRRRHPRRSSDRLFQPRLGV